MKKITLVTEEFVGMFCPDCGREVEPEDIISQVSHSTGTVRQVLPCCLIEIEILDNQSGLC